MRSCQGEKKIEPDFGWVAHLSEGVRSLAQKDVIRSQSCRE